MGPGDTETMHHTSYPHDARAPMGETDNDHLSQYACKIILGGVCSGQGAEAKRGCSGWWSGRASLEVLRSVPTEVREGNGEPREN